MNDEQRTSDVQCLRSSSVSETRIVTSTSPTSNEPKPSLRNVLIDGYSEFKRKLIRRLGSRDLAEDALQETYLKLERAPNADELANPNAYVLRVALNFATDRGRSENRLLTVGEVNSLLDVDDGKPTPESIVGSRSELEMLQDALAELPKRRRDMLLSSRVEETPHREIAAKYGVSTKTVEIEVKRALEHCAVRVGRIAIQRFGPQAVRASNSDDKGTTNPRITVPKASGRER